MLSGYLAVCLASTSTVITWAGLVIPLARIQAMYSARSQISFHQSQPGPSSSPALTIYSRGFGGTSDHTPTTVHRDHDLNDDEGLDPETRKLIADILHKDLQELNASRREKLCLGVPLTDAEYAIQAQAEQLDSMLHEVNDVDIARKTQDTLRADEEEIEQILLSDKVAQQDREFALALSCGEEVPTITAEQMAVEGRARRDGPALMGMRRTMPHAEYGQTAPVQPEQLDSPLHEVSDMDIARNEQDALRASYEEIERILSSENTAQQDWEFALALSRDEESTEQRAIGKRARKGGAGLMDIQQTLPPKIKKAPTSASRKGKARATSPGSSSHPPPPHGSPSGSSPKKIAVPRIEEFLRITQPPPLDYPRLRSLIVERPPFNPSIHSHPEIFEKIVCPYNVEAFEYMLVKHNLVDAYPDLISNMQFGFPLGDMGTLTETRILNNIVREFEHWSEIDKYLVEEVSSGRMDGPYSQSEVESILRGPFQASPLLVNISQQAPGEPDKIRICRHLSKSGDASRFGDTVPSVNSFIQKESFPTRFDTAVRIADALSLAPPGSEACTFDIQKFHRTCPVSPHHKHWLVVQGRRGQFYIDHVHPFGAASASSNAGMIANAAVDIWRAEGANPTFKYEDDISQMRCPIPDGPVRGLGFRYKYDREGALGLISSLDIPWHPEKGTHSYSFDFDFIGFRWNAQLKTVSLIEKKRLKYVARAETFLDNFSTGLCDLRDVERIHGILCHVSFVHLEGRSHLSSFSNFAGLFGGDISKSRPPPPLVLADLRWWVETLRDANFSRPLSPLGPDLEIELYVDADVSWGIGLFIDGSWMAFRLLPGWNSSAGEDGVRRNITWLETVAIELLAYALLELGFFQCRICIHSDNMGVVGAMTKGRSANYHINLSVRRIYSALIPALISPSLKHIKSGSNPAGPVSRGHLPSSPRMALNFTIPPELSSVLEYFC